MTDAIGIEIGRHVVRAVRIDPRNPTELVGSEFTMDPADDASVRDALVRTYGVVATRGAAPPVRLAITPHRGLVQTIDVTGAPRDDVVAISADAARRGAADATTVVDDGVRRQLVLVRWNPPAVERLRSLARQSGFADATAEPAMISLGRVLPPGRHLVWREVEASVGWSALFDEGVPVIGATIGSSGAEPPAVAGHDAPGRHDDHDALLDPDDVLDRLLTSAERPLPGSADRPTRRSLAADLVVDGNELSGFPEHDLRAPHRVAVSVGAALGASGATGRRRTVEQIAPIHVPTAGSRLPWAVESFDPIELVGTDPGETLDDRVPVGSTAAARPRTDADEADRRRGRRRGSRRRYRRRR